MGEIKSSSGSNKPAQFLLEDWNRWKRQKSNFLDYFFLWSLFYSAFFPLRFIWPQYYNCVHFGMFFCMLLVSMRSIRNEKTRYFFFIWMQLFIRSNINFSAWKQSNNKLPRLDSNHKSFKWPKLMRFFVSQQQQQQQPVAFRLLFSPPFRYLLFGVFFVPFVNENSFRQIDLRLMEIFVNSLIQQKLAIRRFF